MQKEKIISNELEEPTKNRVYVAFNMNDEEANNWLGILKDKLVWKDEAVFVSSSSDSDALLQEAMTPSVREKLNELEVIKQEMFDEQRESEILSRQTDANIERIREILGKD